MKSFLIIITLTFALAGCATTVDTQPIYDNYVSQFNASQPNTRHTLARSDGLKIKAREFGAAFRGVRPTLIMMHGFPDNQHLYDPLIQQLSGKFHIVSFDFLGWGASDKPPLHRYDVASQRADLEAVVAQLKLDNVVIVVHDLSGQSGIDWALDNESKTTALVLLNTYYSPMPTLKAPDAIEFYSTPGVLRDLAIWGANKSGSRFQSGLSNQIGAFMSNPASRATYVPIIANAAPSIRPAFFSSTSVLWKELDQRAKQVPRLKQFKKPVHIIFGSDDPFLNAGVARDFGALFPNSSLHLIAAAGHYVQLDNAADVASIMSAKIGMK
jgi:haloalkane dehalogenase